MFCTRWKNVHHPFCGASMTAPVPATLPRCTWLINSAALLVKIHNHVLHQVEKCSPPLLRCFNDCPGARNPAALYLVDQLRSSLGESSQSCSASGGKMFTTPFAVLQRLPRCPQPCGVVPG